MAKELDQEFLEFIVKTLVSNPKDVEINRSIDEMGVLLALKINPDDMGQIIGRQGQTARAIRTLLRIVGAKNNARVNLKIIEPEGSQRPAGRERKTEEVDTSAVDDLKL
ncbi:KH domain-containing protein [Patescibacteria group bacterium]|nr:KH domain-containing protein [Patescibacteria group bacterium]